MQAELRTLKQQYSEAFFMIPKFQRTYAWGIEEWKEFWITVADRSLDIDTSGGEQPPIFMGAIVLREFEKDVVGSREFIRYFLVDGQQRFATTSVFIAVVRDFYFGRSVPYFSNWSNDFLSQRLDMYGNQSRDRLELQDADQSVYEQILKAKSLEEWEYLFQGSHPLNKLYRFFWEKLSTSSDRILEEITDSPEYDVGEEPAPQPESSSAAVVRKPYLQPNEIREWRREHLLNPETLTNIITTQMKFAVIEIQERDKEIAYEVFETLNAKGQSLEEVDKFRNGFFMLDPDNSDSNYTSYWKPMETKAGDNTLLSTFFHEETIRRFGLTPKDRTYQRLMSEIKMTVSEVGLRQNRHARTESVISEFKNLTSSLDAFLIIEKGKDPLAGATHEGVRYKLLLDSLKRMVAGPATPVLMDVIKWSQHSRTDNEIQQCVNEILLSVQGLLVRRLLGGVKPQQLRSLLAPLPRRLDTHIRGIDRAKSCSAENLREYKAQLQKIMISWGPERYPSDSALLANPSRDVYHSGRKPALFAILWDLERSLNPERENDTIPSTLGNTRNSWNIEHVLPQGTKLNDVDTAEMNSIWKSDWVTWGVSNPDSDFAKWVHSLGNLTILLNTANSSVGNNPFEQKKEAYLLATRIVLTDDIKDKETWTPETIEARTNKLLNLVSARWPYPIISN